MIGGCSGTDSSRPLTVSAAACLTPAFQELGRLFERDTGLAVGCGFGATGRLARQIEQGAPVDVFAAADPSYLVELERQGLILRGTRTSFARGRLVLWSPPDSPLQFEALADLLAPAVERLAIANPDHAPYGVAAREALRRAGLWEQLHPRLIMGRNVRQALHYAETGNVDAALVALSLVQRNRGRWTAVDPGLYAPIDQAVAVIRGTSRPAAAQRFAAFLRAPAAQAVLHEYGFLPPAREQQP
jgi:molybdate transport system substrate-binding protein